MLAGSYEKYTVTDFYGSVVKISKFNNTSSKNLRYEYNSRVLLTYGYIHILCISPEDLSRAMEHQLINQIVEWTIRIEVSLLVFNVLSGKKLNIKGVYIYTISIL